jgi:membrane protein DedA with SNARE-associated domain
VSGLLQFLLKHGYIVVFGAAFAEQMGVPLPAVPLIVGMGALSRSGEFDVFVLVMTVVIASLAADSIWYQLGRSHGRSVLGLICRISLEPDYCVRRTEDTFERLGLWTLVAAKFVPGFNAAAVPLAGMIRAPFLRFIIFDLLGVMLWGGTYALLGYIFSEQIERIMMHLATLGTSLVTIVGAAVAIYVSYKLHQRRKFLKDFSVMRITPEELKARMDANEKIVILDIRNRLDRTTDPVRIPGAFHVLPEALEFQRQDIPFDQEIVIYCT